MTQEIDDILQRAAERGRTKALNYSGELTPEETWTLLQGHPRARLIDVRTASEREFVGRVPEAIEIEFKFFPGWQKNAAFVEQVKQRTSPGDLLLFLCRSAHRSHEAAQLLTAEGYGPCFNILEGFEGDKNPEGRRLVNGWKVRGLPWKQ